MMRLTGTAVALLVLALLTTGAAAQGCGCGGAGAKAESPDRDVIIEVEVESECTPTKGSCGGDCEGDGKCAGACKDKAGKKCSGKCGDGGKCGGGCGGNTFVTEFQTDLGDVRLASSDSVTVAGARSLKDAVKDLQKKSKELRKMLRELKESGRVDEAKRLAASLKELNAHIARLRTLAKDATTTKVRGRIVTKSGESVPMAKIVPMPDKIMGGYFELEGVKKRQPVRVRVAKMDGMTARTSGGTSRGWLGITMTPTDAGARVASTVAGSPAERSGIREGDVIVLVGNEKVKGTEHLATLVGGTAPGKIVKLRANRGDKSVWFAVRLGNRPTDVTESIAPPVVVEKPVAARGLVLRRPVAVKEAARPTAVRRVARPLALPGAGAGVGTFSTKTTSTPALRLAPSIGVTPGQVKKQAAHVAALSSKLQQVRIQAQRALAAGQYGQAAEMSQGALKLSKMIPAETKKLAEMKQRAARATQVALDVADTLRARTAPAAAPANVQRLERRMMDLEKRLERIERLLMRLAEK